MARLPRIEALLNASLGAVTYTDLQRLIEGRVVEDVDIDFKSEPHKDGQGLAVDVAAMANTVGGVLVIGMAEADGAATEMRPCPLSDDDTNRMRQWLAELVAPYVSTDIIRVPDAEGARGCYLVVVERSPNAPHAARKGATLRYYQRDGGRNRPLAEAEVADAYRNRFRGAVAQGERLANIAADGRLALDPVPASVAWLAMALMPNAPGSMRIDARQLRRVRQIMTAGADGPFRSEPRELTTGVGRVVAVSGFEHGTTRPRFGYAELHADGSGFAACELLNAPIQGVPDKQPVVRLDDVQMVRIGLGLLRLLSDHSTVGVGAHGDAVARCELLTGANDVRLGYYEHGSIWDRYDTARILRSAPTVGNHTVSLDAILGSPVEWLAAGRVLLTDLFHAFGVPEVPQITNEGHLRRVFWRNTRLDTWPSVAGVPVTDDVIQFRF